MIRSLRRKFLVIAMCSLLGTLVVLGAAIGAVNHVVAAQRADRAIDMLYENNGEFPPPEGAVDPSADFGFQVTQETPFETRYFIVKLTEEQEVLEVDTDHIAALNRQTVVDAVSSILRTGRDRGYSDYYRFGIFQDADVGSTVIVLDCFLQIQSAHNMLRVMSLVFLACALIVFVLLVFFSGKAIRPFAENLERQRQFVTDASHELKTPLAILVADLDLLDDPGHENKWLKSAQAQVARMDSLIRHLVELARTEETIQDAVAEVFSASDVASASAEAFQMLAESAGKLLTAEISPKLYMRGVQDDLFRLLSILLDNAVKYCDPGGTIRLTLFQRGRSLCLTVSNPCAGLDPTQLPRYFDRFYRADSSRARSTGGYGIGLSTAKAIVARHRGRITNRYTGGVITFTVLLPQSLKKGGDSPPPKVPPAS